MDVVDTHTHVISPDAVRCPADPIGGKRSEWSLAHPVDIDGLVRALDAAGVARAVVVQASTVYGHDNRYVAEAVGAHPDRLTGVYSIDALAPDAVERTEHWQGHGLRGFRLFTTGTTMPGQADWLGHEDSFPAWAYAEENDIPVCLQMTIQGLPALRGLLRRFPGVRVLLDHCARPELSDGRPYRAARELFELAAFPGAHLKLTHRALAASAEGASSTPEFLADLIAAYGANRIAWGSNFPAAAFYPAAKGAAVAEPTVLRTVLADYPHTAPLKNGEVTSEAVTLDFHAVSPIHKAFAPMVRTESADLSELAIVTALQAIAYDRPVVLLPAVVASRFQRGCLIAHADRPVAPAELPGRRVGVRAFTQTTGMWVRAHLVEDHGLASRDIRWLTRDGAHVAEYRDPPFVEHGIGEAALPDLLRSGDLDAAILGNDRPEGAEFVPVFPDAAARDREWWRQHGFMPINHVVVAGRTVAGRDPAAIRAGYELPRRADATVDRPDPDAPWPTMFGFERLREPIAFVIETCLEQGLLPRRLAADEVFGPAREILGSAGD